MSKTNSDNGKVLKKYMVNISVLTSVIILIIATMFNEYMSQLLRDLIDPLFSKDLDSNNNPDLYYVSKIKLELLDTVFPIGNIIYNTMMFIIKIVVLFYVIKYILTKTSLAN